MTAPSNIIEFCLKIIQLISITTIEEEKKTEQTTLGNGFIFNRNNESIE